MSPSQHPEKHVQRLNYISVLSEVAGVREPSSRVLRLEVSGQDVSSRNEREGTEKCVLCRNSLCGICFFSADSGFLGDLTHSVCLNSFSQTLHVPRESPTASF